MIKIKIIGDQTVDNSDFVLGGYRYVVERTTSKTFVYKFYDFFPDESIYTGEIDDVVSDDDVRQMILDRTIDFKYRDYSEFEEHFLSEDDATQYFKEHHNEVEKKVTLNYPECKRPDYKCPHCGEDVREYIEEPESAIDVFNSNKYYNGERNVYAYDEVYECPHCGKVFLFKGEY